jgi:hypothetical protein
VSKLLIFASKHQLEITVKGGGHSTGGTSATDGGLVIDLSKMRKVSVDPSKKIITAQGGALWSDVDEAAAEHDLATVGGTVNHTGIGGLTLGGGFGWLTGLYGAVVDNLVAATVVIANGQILHTSDTENSDLFWAIRGAGQNFGVVTEFQYKAYDQPNPVYAGQIIFTPDKLGSIIDVLNERKELGDPRAGFHCFFAVPPGAPGPLIMLICYYNGDEETAKKYLAPVLELQPVSRELQAIPYVKMNGLLNGMTSPGGRKALKGYTVPSKIRKEFAQWLLDEYTMKIKQEPEMVKSFIAIEYYALAKVAAVPVKATAFPTRGNLHAGLIGLGWDDPKKDEDVRAWGRYMQAKCREEIQNVDQINPSISIVYANYLERESFCLSLHDIANEKQQAILAANLHSV